MDPIVLSVFGAAAAVFFSGFGSCLGVGKSGVKSTGVLGERPELFGKLLVITALPGSQGVYGLIIALMILLKAGILGGTGIEVTAVAGSKFLAAGVLMGLSGLVSGWLQGGVSAGGAGAVARNESVSTGAIVLSALIETYAILALVVAIMIINS